MFKTNCNWVARDISIRSFIPLMCPIRLSPGKAPCLRRPRDTQKENLWAPWAGFQRVADADTRLCGKQHGVADTECDPAA